MAVSLANSVWRPGVSNGSSFTFSFNAAGTNTYLISWWIDHGVSQTLSGITFNGVSLATSLVSDTALTAGGMQARGLVAPYNGAANIVQSFSGYVSQAGVSFGAAAFAGVDQTTPVGTTVNNNGTSAVASTGTVTCPDNGAIFGCTHSAYTTSGSPTINSGTLIGAVRTGGGGRTASAGYRLSTGAFAVNLSSSANWRAGGVPINAVAAAVDMPTKPVTILDAVHRASNW